MQGVREPRSAIPISGSASGSGHTDGCPSGSGLAAARPATGRGVDLGRCHDGHGDRSSCLNGEDSRHRSPPIVPNCTAFRQSPHHGWPRERIRPLLPHLSQLLAIARLPNAVSATPLTGRGFDNTVHHVTLADGRHVILRRFREPRAPEHPQARFLMDHAVPALAFLAGNDWASLHAFVPGVLLGDLIETDTVTPAHWRAVGRAFRTTHDVRFPSLLTGEIAPDGIVLRPHDPVMQIHGWIDDAQPGLQKRFPALIEQIPALHEIVDRAAVPLRTAGTALGHGDLNM